MIWRPVLLIFGNFLIQPIICAVLPATESAIESNKQPDSSNGITEFPNIRPKQTESELWSMKYEPSSDSKSRFVEAPGRQVDRTRESFDPKSMEMLSEKINHSTPAVDSSVPVVTDAMTNDRRDEDSRQTSSSMELRQQRFQYPANFPESLQGSLDAQSEKRSNAITEPQRTEKSSRLVDNSDEHLASTPVSKKESSNSGENGDLVEDENQSSQLANAAFSRKVKLSTDTPDQRFDELMKRKVDEKPVPDDLPIQQPASHAGYEDGNHERNELNRLSIDESSEKPSDAIGAQINEHDQNDNDIGADEKESNGPSTTNNPSFSDLKSLKSANLPNKVASPPNYGNVPVRMNESQLRQIVGDPKLVNSLARGGINVDDTADLLKTLGKMNNAEGGLLGAGLSMLSPAEGSDEHNPESFGELLRLKFSLQHWKKMDLRDYFPNLYERFFGRTRRA